MHIEREGTGPIELRLILEPGAAAESPAFGGLVGLALNLISRARTGPRGASVGEELARIRLDSWWSGGTRRGRAREFDDAR